MEIFAGKTSGICVFFSLQFELIVQFRISPLFSHTIASIAIETTDISTVEMNSTVDYLLSYQGVRDVYRADVSFTSQDQWGTHLICFVATDDHK
jgi:hypothetical protein